MSLFSPSAQKADAATADSAAQPVEANSTGENVQQESERTYTTHQFNKAVEKRLKRERDEFAEEKSKLEEKLAQFEKRVSGEKISQNIEEEYRSKLTEYEKKTKKLTEQVNTYRHQHLDSTVEKALA